jgi:hypothetical protein
LESSNQRGPRVERVGAESLSGKLVALGGNVKALFYYAGILAVVVGLYYIFTKQSGFSLPSGNRATTPTTLNPSGFQYGSLN